MNAAGLPSPFSSHAATSGGHGAIMIVEDNFLAAHALSDWLQRWGYTIKGPVGSTDEARALVDDPAIAGAILDINIRGGTTAEVADVLEQRHKPFFFLTGYAAAELLPPRFATRRLLNKPIDEGLLKAAVEAEFGAA